MNLWLTVETRSETAPGSGESAAGIADRDIVHDALGLPFLPGRRIKGALREAAEEVTAALALIGLDARAGAGLAPVEGVFGRPGADEPGWLRVENLVLNEAEETRPWLEWAATLKETALTSERVLAAFTAVRSQTAIDRATGVAAENMLRRTRVLQRGLVFGGPARLSAPNTADEEQARRIVALACAALRRIGLSRNRGLGRVAVRLYSDPSKSIDHTTLALDDLVTLAGRGGG